ncbi:P-loop containing nucleoside triphosphate hydrolase protein [Coprinopsis sp. MPI-PUGE-AT-0042]|nr:P-loop containing nucleoside triphosphate hydrolase protein [Coprinopsis sp. MPI-PUGE-AT-0042]
MSNGQLSTEPPAAWTPERIRGLAQRVFGKRLCHIQLQIIQNLYQKKDVVSCLPTRAGKTLTFWMPVLMAIEDGHKSAITFVITPLNLLSKQNEQQLKQRKYNVIIINPEILMSNTHIASWWKNSKFTPRILNFIFDEGHCISQWGKFRKDYREVRLLRFLMPSSIPFYVATATLPSDHYCRCKNNLTTSRG